MSDAKAAKDALVASLFELSKTANEAANATVNFYRTTAQDGNADTLTQLANTLNTIAASVAGDVPMKAPTVITNGVIDDRKKKKVEKDPNAPKKPLTIFFAFSFHTREVIREERKKKGLPALSAIEMNDIIKERWNSITVDEKAKWQKKYASELKEYQKVKEAYKAGLTPEVKAPLPKPDSDESDDISSSSSDDEDKVISFSSDKKSKDSKKRKSDKSEKKSDKKTKK